MNVSKMLHLERRFILIFLLLAIYLGTSPVNAQGIDQDYQLPPQVLADLVDAPPTPDVSIDPTNTWMLILEQSSLPPITELAQPELKIAGLRINPANTGPSRIRFSYSGMRLQEISGEMAKPVTGLPGDVRIHTVTWSPNGSHFAFIVDQEKAQSLWVTEVSSAKARILVDSVNSVYGTPYHWLSDNETLICKVIPKDRGEAPAAPTVPSGPVIQESTGRKAPARTYQDLLEDSHDEALFEYYLSAQVVTVRLDGDTSQLGNKGLIARAEPSPDGRYLLVETIHRPFSYLVPVGRFPHRIEIWDRQGNVVKQLADVPLAEEIPIGFGAVRTGPREFDWRSDVAATLYWTEARDGGDPKAPADIRDEVMILAAPFTSEPATLAKMSLRYSSIQWANNDLALVTERWWQSRNIKTWVLNPGNREAEPSLLFDYSWQDRYNDPGDPATGANEMGHEVLLTDQSGSKIYLTGPGASPEGDRPFLDELDLGTRQTTRLWRSEEPYYEYVERLLDLDNRTVLTRRESKAEVPNYYLRELNTQEMTQLTDFPHPTPQLAGIQKELIRYERDDGVKLTATLYLPEGYNPQEDGPLPMLMWAYPREFKSADAAGQVTGSPHRFVRVGWGSPILWVTLGYAILDGPTMPIIGEGDAEPNDTYVPQLVASAKAAVDESLRRGIAEQGRIAIGGHSYGAFMTANLLAHSNLFSAGIARSGAYNRSLTPFGFQAEERTFWQAPDVYFQMSPFMHADKVNEPILLIHGEMDNNSGTFPMQSERFYNAIKGHGGKARLVMLPYESHGYRSRESIMHMLAEMTNWLEKYVKNPEADVTTSMK